MQQKIINFETISFSVSSLAIFFPLKKIKIYFTFQF